jgi:undecaprenyl diphosphate synthase
MEIIDQINKENLPAHVAIIMDGNGRWAKNKGKNRIFGHKNGVQSVREVSEAAAKLGIQYLTLYAFSTENWNRPRDEINALMSLLVSSLSSEAKTLMKNNIRLLVIGDIESLPSNVYKKLNAVIKKTSGNTGMNLVLALSYSARWEIVNAVNKLVADVKDGKVPAKHIDINLFATYLNTSEIPDPDILIRTSGEYRISNFLLWQIAYSELYFTKTLWPDFREKEFYNTILDYQNRERRFGKTSEQVKS